MAISDYRYLIVEDDMLVSALVDSMLRKLGATKIEIAANGVMALGHLAKAQPSPDIIISDLNMPHLDGVELMRNLGGKQFTGGIILISSSDQRFLRTVVNLAEAYYLNVLGALSKPFAPSALQNLLAGYAGAKEMAPRHAMRDAAITPETLRPAIEAGQMVPYFQPKVDVRTGSVVGVEVLARWLHPEKGVIMPGLFIPVAEEHGLIDLLTEDILRQTLKQVAVWHRNGLLFAFAINFSALSLADKNLPNRLAATLEETGIDPSYLTLEITESHLLEDIKANIEILLRLRLKGIHLSIDDFGTGHSSLEQLHRIPFSELKIDRMFVNGAAHDKQIRVFLQSTAILAKQLNLSIVAEGVETREDWDVCATMGCDLVQGYFIARPMAGGAFLEWFNNRESTAARISEPESRRS